jgi:hypothetical protein
MKKLNAVHFLKDNRPVATMYPELSQAYLWIFLMEDAAYAWTEPDPLRLIGTLATRKLKCIK